MKDLIRPEKDLIIDPSNMGRTDCGLIWQLRPTKDWFKTPSDTPYECGYANGYVGLPKGHKYYGVNYDGIEVENIWGDLTYSEEHNGYWVIGFDVMHFRQNSTNFNRAKCLSQLMDLVDQMKRRIK